MPHFFVSYNSLSGKRFEPKRRLGPDRANELVPEGLDRQKSKSAGS